MEQRNIEDKDEKTSPMLTPLLRASENLEELSALASLSKMAEIASSTKAALKTDTKPPPPKISSSSSSSKSRSLRKRKPAAEKKPQPQNQKRPRKRSRTASVAAASATSGAIQTVTRSGRTVRRSRRSIEEAEKTHHNDSDDGGPETEEDGNDEDSATEPEDVGTQGRESEKGGRKRVKDHPPPSKKKARTKGVTRGDNSALDSLFSAIEGKGKRVVPRGRSNRSSSREIASKKRQANDRRSAASDKQKKRGSSSSARTGAVEKRSSATSEKRTAADSSTAKRSHSKRTASEKGKKKKRTTAAERQKAAAERKRAGGDDAGGGAAGKGGGGGTTKRTTSAIRKRKRGSRLSSSTNSTAGATTSTPPQQSKTTTTRIDSKQQRKQLIAETGKIDTSQMKVRFRNTFDSSAMQAIIPSPKSEECLRQLTVALKSKKFRSWCRCEFFVSAIDRLYFAQNDFMECLYEYGMGNIKQITRTEWSYVRSIIGKPRRMSAAFFREERKKLERYRDDVRCIQQGLTVVCDEFPFPEEVPARLVDGQTVVAVHPSTGELHTGVVMPKPPRSSPSTTTTSSSSSSFSSQRGGQADQQGSVGGGDPYAYQIAFDQEGLGSGVLVSDTKVMPYGHLHSSLSQLQHPVGPRFPHAHGDAHMVANLLRLLDRKEALLTHLRTMNDLAESMQNEAEAKAKAKVVSAKTTTVKKERDQKKQQQSEGAAASTPHMTTTSSSSSPALQNGGTYRTAKNKNNNELKSITKAAISSSSSDSAAASTPLPPPPVVAIPPAFKQQCAWVIVELEKASRDLDNALQAMRLRQSGISLGEAGSDLSVHVSQLCYQRAREIMQSLRDRLVSTGSLSAKSSSGMPSKMSNLIVCCISLVLLIKFCAERGLQPLGLNAFLESVRPTHPQNQKLFEKIETSFRQMQSMLSLSAV